MLQGHLCYHYTKWQYGIPDRTWTCNWLVRSEVVFQLAYRSIWSFRWESNPELRFCRPHGRSLPRKHFWLAHRDLNPKPFGYEPNALTNWAMSQYPGRDERSRTDDLSLIRRTLSPTELHPDIWSAIRYLKPHQQFGRLLCYHYTNRTFWADQRDSNSYKQSHNLLCSLYIMISILGAAPRVELGEISLWG